MKDNLIWEELNDTEKKESMKEAIDLIHGSVFVQMSNDEEINQKIIGKDFQRTIKEREVTWIVKEELELSLSWQPDEPILILRTRVLGQAVPGLKVCRINNLSKFADYMFGKIKELYLAEGVEI